MAISTISTYQPSPKQQAFHADDAKFRLLLGAWRAGKSIAMIWEVLMTALEYPGARLVIFRKTYPALRDTTWRDMMRECPSELIQDYRAAEGREEITLPGGSQILGRCLDDWKKLGSASFDLICCDEAYEFTEDEFDMLAKGRLSGQIGPRRMILATNPPNRDHWLYRRFVTKKADNMSVHHFATTDNYTVCDLAHPKACQREVAHILPDGDPAPDGVSVHHNLPPGYIDELRAMPENKRRRFLEGAWGYTTEGTPIFGEFSESRHAAALKPDKSLPVYRGWDFGYRHPAVVWLQVLKTGHVHVLHELMGDSEDIESFARRVQRETALKFPNYPTIDYCDIAGIQKHDLGIAAIGVLRKCGIHPRFRKLRVWKTIEGIRDLLARTNVGVPLLRIHIECHWLIEAFAGGYIVKVKPTGEEEPERNGEPGTYTHIVDALRYALADIFFPTHAGRAAEFKPTRTAARYAI